MADCQRQRISLQFDEHRAIISRLRNLSPSVRRTEEKFSDRCACVTCAACSRDVKQRFTFLRRHSDSSGQRSAAAASHVKTSKSLSSAAAVAAAVAVTPVSAERLQLWAQSMEHLLADDCKSSTVVLTSCLTRQATACQGRTQGGGGTGVLPHSGCMIVHS